MAIKQGTLPTYSDAQSKMHWVLGSLATRDEIRETLGIAEEASMPEEFWVGQGRAVRRRFMQYCLQQMGVDLSTLPENLTNEVANRVSELAAQHVAKETFTYATVRSCTGIRPVQLQPGVGRTSRTGISGNQLYSGVVDF